MSAKTTLICDRCGGTADVRRGVLYLNELAAALGSNPFGHFEWDLCAACVKTVANTLLPLPSSPDVPPTNPPTTGATGK